MRTAGLLAAASLAVAACTSLRMTAPETGDGGAGGAAGAGAAGDSGVAGTGAGTGGTGGTGGTTAGTGGGGRGGAGGTIAEPAGLIAFWRFNEGSGSDVADSSGNNHTLTLATGAGSWASGHEGMAFSLDGASDLARAVPVAGQPLWDYPTVPLTFSAWVKPGAGAASRAFATAVARTHEDYAFQDFWLGLADGKPACTIHSPAKVGPVASAVAPAGIWTHIACTYGLSETVNLYVNGVLAASYSTAQVLGPIPTAILVGASETAGQKTISRAPSTTCASTTRRSRPPRSPRSRGSAADVRARSVQAAEAGVDQELAVGDHQPREDPDPDQLRGETDDLTRSTVVLPIR